MNTAIPLVVALALFPMVGVLKLLNRSRGWYQHFVFMLGFSNAVWLVTMLLLPLAVWNDRVYALIALVMIYVYLGVGYFAFYRERTRLKTAGKFLVFAVADFVVTNVVQLPLMWLIFLSALRF